MSRSRHQGQQDERRQAGRRRIVHDLDWSKGIAARCKLLQSSYPGCHQRITVNRCRCAQRGTTVPAIRGHRAFATCRCPSRVRRRSGCACTPRASTAPTCCSGWDTIPRRRDGRRRSPVSSTPASSRLRGPGTSRWQTGDRVMGLVGGGAHAEAVVVREDEVVPIPRALLVCRSGCHPGGIPHGLGCAGASRARRRPAIVCSSTPWEAVSARRPCSSRACSACARSVRRARRPSSTASWRWDWTRRSTRALAPFREQISGDGARASSTAWVARRSAREPGGAPAARPAGAHRARCSAARGDIDLGFVLRQRTRDHRDRRCAPAGRRSGQRWRASSPQEVLPGVRASPPVARVARLGPVVDAVMPMNELARAHELMEENETFGKVVMVW